MTDEIIKLADIAEKFKMFESIIKTTKLIADEEKISEDDGQVMVSSFLANCLLILYENFPDDVKRQAYKNIITALIIEETIDINVITAQVEAAKPVYDIILEVYNE